MTSDLVGKWPDEVVPGEIVIPARGRYQGVQCKVKDVRRGEFGTFTLTVVPVIPIADEVGVDPSERVRTVGRG